MNLLTRFVLTGGFVALTFQQTLVALLSAPASAPPPYFSPALSSLALQHARALTSSSIFDADPVPISVYVEAQSSMPPVSSGLPVIAHTTKDSDGTCVLHMTEEAIREKDGLAHEVCHCVLDYGSLGLHGYSSETSKAAKTESESRADACGEWLASDLPADVVMRLQGVVPSRFRTRGENIR